LYHSTLGSRVTKREESAVDLMGLPGEEEWFRGGLVFEAHRLLYHSDACITHRLLYHSDLKGLPDEAGPPNHHDDKWIRTRRLSIKNSLSVDLTGLPEEEALPEEE